MLSLEFIRENPELVKKAAAEKGDQVDVDRILKLDAERRKSISEVEKLKAERNAGSREVGRLMKSDREAAGKLKTRMKELGEEAKRLETALGEVQGELDALLLAVPNVPDEASPQGQSEADNVEVRSWGEKPAFDFEPAPHWELGEKLGILDFKRAAKVAGSGFAVLRGAGARLELALVNYMLDLARGAGYTDVFAPYLVNRKAMTGTGQLPKLEDDMYRLESDDLFLIPTAEVPVTNLHAGEIFQAAQLPLKYCCYSACFRREAGSYGKDTRGMVRVHQFNKVELVKFAAPETSAAEHQALLADAERVLQGLGLHYRVSELCRGELSFAGARCFDLEVWAPGMDKYLEVSSVSNFRDFQARRANIRYRAGQDKPGYCHTLNGSGTALPRLVVALMESGQAADGTVLLPEAIRPYMGGAERLEAE